MAELTDKKTADEYLQAISKTIGMPVEYISTIQKDGKHIAILCKLSYINPPYKLLVFEIETKKQVFEQDLSENPPCWSIDNDKDDNECSHFCFVED